VVSDEWRGQGLTFEIGNSKREVRKSEIRNPPPPLVFVNVASKGLSIYVSRLESTVARGSQVLHVKDLWRSKVEG
jgi:hypothetical protein